VNWTEIADALISGKYHIQRNTRGRHDVWFYSKAAGPVSLARDIEGLQRAKDLAENHKKAHYSGVAIDASSRG
jgi:hypothetical protein